jgi:hypothetical protein
VEIQRLQEECKKMTQEVDLSLDAQVPLGETDEEFYKNIYTGQQGFILSPSSQPLPPSEFYELQTDRWKIIVFILSIVFCNFCGIFYSAVIILKYIAQTYATDITCHIYNCEGVCNFG